MPDYRHDNPYQLLLATALERQGVDIVFPSGYRRMLPIFRACRDHSPVDVLHLHWSEPFSKGKTWFRRAFYWTKLLMDLWFVRLSGIRVIWTLHNLMPHECSYPQLEKYFRQRLLRGMSHVIVHGRQSYQDVIAVLSCPADKVTVVHHGNYQGFYPLATLEMRCESRGSLPVDHRVFMFFGIMRPYKGIERLLRAWHELQPENASLWLAGPCSDPVYEAELRSIAANMPNVRFECGFVPKDHVSRLFAGADVVVLPFQRVQTAGSVILALSFGKPVIAPRIGEVPETVGDADALLYDAQSNDGLSSALRRALTGDLRDVSVSSKASGDRLNWGSVAAKTNAIYSAAVSTCSRS